MLSLSELRKLLLNGLFIGESDRSFPRWMVHGANVWVCVPQAKWEYYYILEWGAPIWARMAAARRRYFGRESVLKGKLICFSSYIYIIWVKEVKFLVCCIQRRRIKQRL